MRQWPCRVAAAEPATVVRFWRDFGVGGMQAGLRGGGGAVQGVAPARLPWAVAGGGAAC